MQPAADGVPLVAYRLPGAKIEAAARAFFRRAASRTYRDMIHDLAPLRKVRAQDRGK
jgi:hypothetical protein